MNNRKKNLFVQLPHLDNHIGGHYENIRLAAVYLQCSIERTGESRYFESSVCPAITDEMDDRHLVDYIVEQESPSVIAATVYLWNIERTLNVLKAVKQRMPSVKILLGGPEVAPDHPFLFKSGIPDAVIVGEGEQVLPAILKVLRTSGKLNLAAVAWKKGTKYNFGTEKSHRAQLSELLPPPLHKSNKPDANGIAYMETSRGCPLSCTFCCYNHTRPGVSYISAVEVLSRAEILVGRGAKEIRFIDPTFNSNPDFEEILKGLTELNRRHRISFFAELRAETVTERQAALLKKANFKEIEVGVQSRDKEVLRLIKRPTRLDMLDRGIRYMSRNGIRLTIDIMCGLPLQRLEDIRKSLRWAFSVKNAYIQFLHTLLIPGTELRAKRRQLGLVCQRRPPYRVTSTSLLQAEDLIVAERIAWKHAGRLMDSPADKFIGRLLPDLFKEKVVINLIHGVPEAIPGKSARRAVIIRGENLFGSLNIINGIIRMAIKEEPHVLWQFVVSPSGEEPLDLFDYMIDEIDKWPEHLLDNMAVNPDGRRRVARRIFVLLRSSGEYRRSWVDAVEKLLRSNFY